MGNARRELSLRSDPVLRIFIITLALSLAGKVVLNSITPHDVITSDSVLQANNNNLGQYPMVPPGECDVDAELVIDISGSMGNNAPDGRQNLDWAKEAANNFIQEMTYIDGLENNEVRVGLSTFGMTYYGAFNSGIIRQPLTSEWWRIHNAVNNLTSSSSNGFGTCVECGIRAGRADLFNNIEDPNRPKVIIMLSDGYGNRTLAAGNTRVPLETARSAAISESFTGKGVNRITYFVVGYGRGSTFDQATLTGVSNDPDSTYYAYYPNVEDWVSHFRELAIKVCDRPVTNSCTVASTQNTTAATPLTLAAGSTTQIGTNFTNFSPLGGSAEVRYRFSNSGVASFSPTGNFTVPNPSGATGLSYYFTRVNVSPLATAPPDSTTELIADVYIGGAFSCSARTFLKTETLIAKPWWQIYGGDIVAARGSILSHVVEDEALMSSNYNGLPVFEGIIDPSNSAQIGVPGWRVDTPYSAHIAPTGSYYNYNYFAQKFTPSVALTQASITSATFFDINSGTLRGGYQVYARDGDLDLGTLNFVNGTSKKVIILVTGNVYLNGKIQLDDGKDFFMVIARGSIFVSGNVGDTTVVVSGTAGTEDLEGIYITDGQFITSYDGASLKQLVVRGTVVGWGNSGLVNGVDFGRSLGSTNASRPSEIFKFAPDLLLNFPPFYAEKTITWKEVRP